MSNKFYDEGRAAFISTPRFDNPYPYESDAYFAWAAGWDDAYDEAYN